MGDLLKWSYACMLIQEIDPKHFISNVAVYVWVTELVTKTSSAVTVLATKLDMFHS